ncbi:MAG: hypothetical protein M0P71_16555 [Melioribacteraceae bacterium]|nr:hypothetical protein [Melioribacteraceae bacterium]
MNEKELYQKCMTVVSKNEGGYVFDINDPGGETYCGISRKNNPDWEGWDIIDEYKKSHTLKRYDFIPGSYLESLINDFYEQKYWRSCNLFGITSPEIVLNIFDFAVNSGRSTAIKKAQVIAGVKVDGICGWITKNAINAFPEQLFIGTYRAARVNFLKSLKTYKYFGTGWLKRIKNTHF